MKSLKSLVLTTCAALLAAGLVLPGALASAEGSAALSIVPEKNYSIEPGDSVDDTLIIRNLDSSESLNLSLRVVDFTYTDEGGTPKLMLDEEAQPTTWSLKPFLSLPETVTVDPGSTATIDMSVSVPSNHGAGSYYSAIVYSSGPSDGLVGLSASGVTLVFTSIPGDVDEQLTLEQFGAYQAASGDQEAGYAGYITTDKPEMIAYTLKNDGNVTESPVGSITLDPLFREERVISDINPNGSLALIGQTRTFTTCLKLESQEVDFQGRESQTTACTEPDLWPGYYNVTLNGFYGQNGNLTKEIIGNASFWYLPWWFILTASIGLLLVAYFVWRIVSFFQRHFGKNKYRKSSRRK